MKKFLFITSLLILAGTMMTYIHYRNVTQTSLIPGVQKVEAACSADGTTGICSSLNCCHNKIPYLGRCKCVFCVPLAGFCLFQDAYRCSLDGSHWTMTHCNQPKSCLNGTCIQL